MSYNPRSRIPGILAVLDLLVCAYVAVRHPVRYLARRRHVPRHARKETFVLPDALTSDAEFVTAIPDAYGPAPANYCRTDEFPALTLDGLFPPRTEVRILGEELNDLIDAGVAA